MLQQSGGQFKDVQLNLHPEGNVACFSNLNVLLSFLLPSYFWPGQSSVAGQSPTQWRVANNRNGSLCNQASYIFFNA